MIDSRSINAGRAIRRRRQCLACSRRFTTFERLEELALFVSKRSGDRVPFDPEKVAAGILAACKNRPVDSNAVADLVAQVEERLRASGTEVVPSAEVGREVLEGLRDLDQVAYLRFASVYKVFDDPADFTKEVGLMTKQTEPKRR